jgi:hypothetical protein
MDDIIQIAVFISWATHIGSLILPKLFRRETDLDPELVRQHHEKCVVLSLIAAAIAFHK